MAVGYAWLGDKLVGTSTCQIWMSPVTSTSFTPIWANPCISLTPIYISYSSDLKLSLSPIILQAGTADMVEETGQAYEINFLLVTFNMCGEKRAEQQASLWWREYSGFIVFCKEVGTKNQLIHCRLDWHSDSVSCSGSSRVQWQRRHDALNGKGKWSSVGR